MRVATIARVTRLRRLIPLVLLPLLVATAGCGSDTKTPHAEKSQCTYTQDAPASKKVEPPPGNPPKDLPAQAILGTDLGDVKISFDADKAPCATNAFMSLAKQGFYDNTLCHRLTVSGKMGLNVLQCGDPTGTGGGGPGYGYDAELVDGDPRLQPCYGQTSPDTGKEYCTYPAGTVAMANATDPGTTGSQFFLVYQDSVLDASFTVLGRMNAAGLKVVQQVAKAGVVPGTEQPKKPLTITSVK